MKFQRLDKLLMQIPGERFGENVGGHFRELKVFQSNEAVSAGIPNMVILDCNVLGPLIESWLFNKLKSTLVVGKNSLWYVVCTSNLMIEPFEPNGLSGGL